MSWKIFNGFCMNDGDLTCATTEDAMTNASELDNRQTILYHTGTRTHGGAEMNEERKVSVGKRGGTLRGSVALCEDFGRKGRKERKEAGKDGTMNHQTTKLPNHQTSSARWASDERRVTSDEFAVENHQTTKRPNYQTGLARWAAVAAGGRGMRLEGARGAHTEALRHGEGRGGHMGRMGHTGLLGQLGRWAAVAAVAAGAWLEGAREAEVAA